MTEPLPEPGEGQPTDRPPSLGETMSHPVVIVPIVLSMVWIGIMLAAALGIL